MAFDFAWDARASAGFVTDPAYAVPLLGESYPTTYTNGNGLSINAGFSVGAPSGGNRNSGIDVRLAGDNFLLGSGVTFKVDLSSGSAPGAGSYTLDGAMGLPLGAASDINVDVKDTSTTLLSFSGSSPANTWLDITGVQQVPGSGAWAGNTVSKTFATTSCLLDVSPQSGGYCGFAHFRLTLAGGSDTPLTPTVGALILAGLAPLEDFGRVPVVGALTLAGLTSSLLTPLTLTPASGPLVLSSQVVSFIATTSATKLANLQNIGQIHGDGIWQDGALLVGTTNVGSVIVQATGLDGGFYLVGVTGSCSVDWVYDVQQQDQFGAVKHTERRRRAAGNEDAVFPWKVKLALNDQLVVVLAEGNVTGTLQMSLVYQGMAGA